MRLKWDETGERYYSTGVSNVVLFVQNAKGAYENGVAWSGVTSIEENPDGGDANDYYADNLKYLSLRAVEDYGATINAYQSPEEFDVCDGTASPIPGIKIKQQVRRPFGFCYETLIGNDTEGTDHGKELHVVYNATCSPSSRTYESVNDSPEPAELSWEVETTPVPVTGYKPTSSLVFSSLELTEAQFKAAEDKLFGTDPAEGATGEGTAATLPTPDDLIAFVRAAQ